LLAIQLAFHHLHPLNLTYFRIALLKKKKTKKNLKNVSLQASNHHKVTAWGKAFSVTDELATPSCSVCLLSVVVAAADNRWH
jgi:hypothetical protein